MTDFGRSVTPEQGVASCSRVLSVPKLSNTMKLKILAGHSNARLSWNTGMVSTGVVFTGVVFARVVFNGVVFNGVVCNGVVCNGVVFIGVVLTGVVSF